MSVQVGSAVAYLELNTEKFEQGFKNAKVKIDSAVSSLGNSLSGIGSGISTNIGSALSSTFASFSTLLTDIGGQIDNFGAKLSDIGSTLTKTVSLPIVGVGTAAAKTAIDFEDGMAKVSAISGATGQELEELRDKAIEMGANTRYSASDAADAFNYMAMAGWDSKQMIDAIAGTMNLAAASGEDLGLVSDIVTDAMTAFGLSADKAGYFADILATTAASANTNVGLLGESFKYVAPVAGSLGYTVDDVAVALGIMANTGIKGSEAGTALRSALTNLVKPTDAMVSKMLQLGLATDHTTTAIDSQKLENAQNKLRDRTLALEKAQLTYNDAVAKYGVESVQAEKAALNVEAAQNKLADAQAAVNREMQGTLESHEITIDFMKDVHGEMIPLTGILNTLRVRFKSLSEEEKANAAATLFGKEAMSGMLAIINSSDEEWENLVYAMDEAEGAAQNMSDTMEDTTGGAIRAMKSALETLMIAIGDRLTPYIRKAAEFVKELAAKIANLSDEQLDWIIKIGMLVAAIGPLLSIGGKLISGIGKVITFGGNVIGLIPKIISVGGGLIGGIGKIGGAIGSFIGGAGAKLVGLLTSLGPQGLLIAGVAAGVAFLVYEVVKHWDSIKEFFGNIWNTVKETFGNIWEHITGFFGKIGDFIKENWQGLLLMLVNPIVGLFKLLYDNFDGFHDFIDNLAAKIKEFFGNVVDGAKNLAKNVWDGITSAFGKIGDWIAGVWNSVVDFLKNAGAGIVDFFKNVCENIVETAKNFVVHLGETIRVIIDKVKEICQAIVDHVVDFFKNIIDKVKEFVGNVVDNVIELKDKVVEKVKELVDKVVEFFTGLVDKIKVLWEKAKQFVTSVVDGIKNTFNSIVEFFQNVFDKIAELFGKIFETLSAWWEKIKGQAQAAISFVKDNVLAIIQKVHDTVKEFFDKVVEWFANVWNKIKEFFQNVFDSVVGFFKDVIAKIVSVGKDIRDKVTNFGKDVIQKIKDILTGMIDKVKEFVPNMTQAAKDFIAGFVKGIAEKASAAYDKVKEFGQGIIDKVKGVLKIHSPSQVGDEIGQLFDDGVGNGIVKGTPGVLSKAGESSSQIQGAFTANMSSMISSVKATISQMQGVLGEVVTWFNQYGGQAADQFGGKMYSMFDAIRGGLNKLENDSGGFLSRFADGFRNMFTNLINGSHESGLSYVPFNGYIAELHEGERVLTKKENQHYNDGKRGGSGGGDTYVFYNTKPDPYEYSRQMKRVKRELAL